MDGWKTKWGSICLSAGGALLACAELMDIYPVAKLYVQIAGTLLATGGGSLMGYGIGHKIEKTCEKPK